MNFKNGNDIGIQVGHQIDILIFGDSQVADFNRIAHFHIAHIDFNLFNQCGWKGFECDFMQFLLDNADSNLIVVQKINFRNGMYFFIAYSA